MENSARKEETMRTAAVSASGLEMLTLHWKRKGPELGSCGKSCNGRYKEECTLLGMGEINAIGVGGGIRGGGFEFGL